MSEPESPETEQGGEPEVVRANLNRELSTSPDFASLYTNDVQVQISPWDVRLIFGQIESGPTKEKLTVTVKQVGEVRMSPQLAKKVATILTKQIQTYERRFGTIPQPTD
jgi:hypothetical protein